MADAKEVQQYNQAARLNDYRANVENYFAQKEQNEVNRVLQQEQQLDTHIQNLKIRDVQLNANLKAWEKSEQGYLDQLQLNEQAQQVALMGEQKVMDERMLEAAFATDELNIRQQQQVLESKFSFEQQQNSLADAVADYDFQIAVNSLMFQESQEPSRRPPDHLQEASDHQNQNQNVQIHENHSKSPNVARFGLRIHLFEPLSHSARQALMTQPAYRERLCPLMNICTQAHKHSCNASIYLSEVLSEVCKLFA